MKETREIIVAEPIEKVELERPFDQQIPASNGRYQAYRGLYDQEGSQIIEYWRAIRKRLWLVVGIAVLFTTLAAIYMVRRPDIYQAHSVVQVDLEQANPDLVTDDRRRPSMASDPAYFNTQLQLLASEGLLRRVVKEYSLDTNKEFQKEKGEGNSSALRSLLKTIGLASDGKPKTDEGVQEISETNSENLSSEEMAEAIRLAPYVDIIKKNLTVEPVREARTTSKETRLIDIYYRNNDPELAAFVVNSIATVFAKQNQEKRTGTSRKTNDFLEERVANLQSEIKAGEEKLVRLSKDAGMLKKDEQTTIAIERLTGLNKQLLDAEEARKTAESKYNAIKNSPERLNALVEVEMQRYLTERDNDVRQAVIQTQRDIAKLRAEKEKLAVEYQPSAPEIAEIDTQIEALNKEINDARSDNTKDLQNFRQSRATTILNDYKRQYDQTQETENKMRSAFNQQYSLAQGQDVSAVAIRLLQQDIETKREFLKNLETNQRGNDIAAIGTENNISQIEVAIPPDRPIAPSRLTSVLAALILSTLFGAGLALFLEYLDDSIRSTEDIEKYLGLPALAAIPSIESLQKRRLALVGGNEDAPPQNQNSELLIHTDSRSSIAEAYRQLRTSILLSSAGHAPKSLLITSSLPAEGKTTTATNTAISLAQTGAKVLLIDADMRRPRMHGVFNISNAVGLSSVLSTELSREEVLDSIQYDKASNLHLLPSGPVPPNPAELIGSEQMAKVFNILREEFTHVVVDSPPIASFTDGVLIASMVDGVILVVHSGKSSRQVVRRSRQLLQDVGAKVFGVVLNKVNLRSQDNYYYYQSYYHRSYYRHDDEDED